MISTQFYVGAYNRVKDLQEGHELMNLQTGESISRPFVKAAPMPISTQFYVGTNFDLLA